MKASRYGMRWAFRAAALLSAAAILTAAGPAAAAEPLKIAYVEWSSAIASANLVKAVVQEKLGRECRLMAMGADEMWAAVAEGRADAMVSAWLPDTHGHYHREFREEVVDLGPNLEGTKIGLVVPNVTVGRLTAGTGIRNRPYMDVEAIPDLNAHAEELRRRIIGIDAEAGIMRKTREAMTAYDLDRFRLIEGSEVSMVAELTHAIQRQRWIVVTGWLPHWIFARWDLKFLDDPKGIYGSGGSIHTMVHPGLDEEMPEVHRFLDRFHWTPVEMAQLMLWNRQEEGLFPYEKALRWMNSHPERVNDWLSGETD